MAIPLFLAMTGAEFSKNQDLPPKLCWMACHFSAYGTGLSNMPKSLPQGSMIIINDRIPVCGHDPVLIGQQLSQLAEEMKCSAVLLDFQRPDVPETAEIAKVIVDKSPCPVGITEYYARELDCPVFLPPAPPHISLAEYLAPWQGREIWLEAALDGIGIVVTPEGSRNTPLYAPETSDICHHNADLHCHYDIGVDKERISFRLYRTLEDLHSLLTAGEQLGVTRAVGLYQELKDAGP